MRGKGKEKDEKGEKGWAATDANGKEKDEKVENNAKGKETGQKGAAVNAGKEGTAGAKGKGNGGQAEDNRQKAGPGMSCTIFSSDDCFSGKRLRP